MRQKNQAPLSVRKEPEIFWRTLIMRMSCSAWLLVKGTRPSHRKARMLHSKSSSRSNKLAALALRGSALAGGQARVPVTCAPHHVAVALPAPLELALVKLPALPPPPMEGQEQSTHLPCPHGRPLPTGTRVPARSARCTGHAGIAHRQNRVSSDHHDPLAAAPTMPKASIASRPRLGCTP